MKQSWKNFPKRGEATDSNIPAGLIAVWSGIISDIPAGWVVCNGTNGTPDLQDKFVLGAGTNHTVGETGGAEKVTLTVAQIPSHSHAENYGGNDISVTYEPFVFRNTNALGTYAGYAATPSSKAYVTDGSNVVVTNQTGGSQPHPNMPPYYSLLYIMKT